ncbi:restriction endonuclease [Piscinibacter sp.]|uniref:restriction endonuclease n=1 Tax=Piscinibacter sp. TaxID=1903157 RepID=UPI002C1030A8|nr:restriction endonuclease [Albitalea sp.]HUG21694.1 restriction endonuclease [Albitalea sp.]
MKLKMAENSLFAILLRSRWWVSGAIAVVLTLIAQALLPKDYAILGAFSALPFIAIAGVAAWRQMRLPSPARVADVVQAVSAMPWAKFADVVEAGYRRQGHAVTRLPGPAADFELVKDGRTTLVSGKRWKAARVGVEPLRGLQAAREARDAHAAAYIAIGELSDGARTFVRENGIQVLQGDELAMLLRDAAKGRNA